MHIITRSATRDNPSLLLKFMMCGGFYRHHRDGTYRIRTIDGDGNCLFRSLSFFVYHDEDQHHRIRHRLVYHVSNNWNYFKNFSTSKNALSYRCHMASPGAYGTESEIFAFSEEYNRRVVIYFKDRPDQDPVEIGSGDDYVCLLYSGPTDHGHYDVLIKDNCTDQILAEQKKNSGTIEHGHYDVLEQKKNSGTTEHGHYDVLEQKKNSRTTDHGHNDKLVEQKKKNSRTTEHGHYDVLEQKKNSRTTDHGHYDVLAEQKKNSRTNHGHYDVLAEQKKKNNGHTEHRQNDDLAEQKMKNSLSCSNKSKDFGERKKSRNLNKDQVKSTVGSNSQRTRQNQCESRSKNTEGSQKTTEPNKKESKRSIKK